MGNLSKRLIYLLFCILLLSIVTAQDTTYTPTTKTVCTPIEKIKEICYADYCVDYDTYENGTVYCLDLRDNYCRDSIFFEEECTKTLYSGTRYVYEDGVWKNIEDSVKSLKDYYKVKYLETDPDFDMDVIDFNNSGILIHTNFTGNPSDYPEECTVKSDIEAKCQFKISDKWEVDGIKYEIKYDYKWEMKDGIIVANDYKFQYTSSPLGRQFKFGGNSTTITLQDADTENLEDAYVQYNIIADTNYGDATRLSAGTDVSVLSIFSFIKFNISSIPDFSSVNDAMLGIFIKSNDYDNGDTIETYVYEVSNQTWWEGNGTISSGITYDHFPEHGNQIDENTTIPYDADDFWLFFNVTSWVDNQYDDSYDNVSFLWNATLQGQNDKFDACSKESTSGDPAGCLGVSTRPFLNITYIDLNNITISDCTELSEDNSHYFLNQSIANSTTSNCMYITGNNVTLDCQGNTIDGDDTADYGIITTSWDGIYIKNCYLSDWDTSAIKIPDVDHKIHNIHITSSPDDGIYVVGQSAGELDVYIENSTIDLSGNGIHVYGTIDYHNVHVENVNITNSSSYGYYQSNDASGKLTDVIILNSGKVDVYITPTSSDVHCGAFSSSTNIIGTGNKPISVLSAGSSISDTNNVSEIITCEGGTVHISNVTIDQTGYDNNGIFVIGSEINITNVDLIQTYYGLFCLDCDDSTVENLSVYNSTSNAFYNDYSTITLFNSIFQSSSTVALYTCNGYSTIYNSIINHTGTSNGVSFDCNSGFFRYWNTTKQAGTRILNKIKGLIGGNYWATYTGAGFSENCTDSNTDGICDINHTLQSNNIDYLPLSNVTDTTSPVFKTSPIIYPLSSYKNQTMYCNYTITDNILLGLYADVDWYINNSLVLNGTETSITNNTNIKSPNFTNLTNKTDEVNCSITVYDAYRNSINEISNITILNSIPTISSIVISPSPADNSDDLNCSYIFSDIDLDTESSQEFRWYNDSILYGMTNQILGSGNTSGSEKWLCSIRVNDSEEWSSWYNSSELTIGDSTAPIMQNYSVSSSGTVQVQVNVTADCYDAGSSINYLKVNVTDPDTVKTTYTASSSSGNTQIILFTPTKTGNYTFTEWICADTSGNSITNSSSFDMNIISAPAPPSGGGGGGDEQPQVKFNIVTVNAFSEETAQLGIRPSSTREYCLDIINTATVTQVIKITCEDPEATLRNACLWYTFKCQNEVNCEKTDNLLYMTVLPSSETRETFCMDIETPIDIIIGERYVVNIIGEVTSPASLKGAKDTHPITKYVTDPSLLFGEILDKFKDNSIGVLIYDYMKQYIKEDINEIELVNAFNPVLWLTHALMLFWVILLFKKAKFSTHLISQIIMFVFTIISLFYNILLFWTYIVLIFLIGWTLIIIKVVKPKRKRKKNI